MRERDRLRKVRVQEEQWRRNALAFEEGDEEGEEGDEDVSDISSQADEDLVQRKQERTYTVAEDNVEENLKCVLATCGFCPKEFVKKDVYYLCSICQSQAYCGDECQRRHWPQHKKVCSH